MEEDIKMLKDRIEYHKLDPEDDNGRVSFMLEEIDQLENVLNRLEEDERVIEEMAKWINDLGCIDLDINKDIIDHFRKKCE